MGPKHKVNNSQVIKSIEGRHYLQTNNDMERAISRTIVPTHIIHSK